MTDSAADDRANNDSDRTASIAPPISDVLRSHFISRRCFSKEYVGKIAGVAFPCHSIVYTFQLQGAARSDAVPPDDGHSQSFFGNSFRVLQSGTLYHDILLHDRRLVHYSPLHNYCRLQPAALYFFSTVLPQSRRQSLLSYSHCRHSPSESQQRG